MFGDLPDDVILSIQRILELQYQESDPYGTLTNDFNIAQALDVLFPDESSISSAEAAAERLSATQRDLEREVIALQGELRDSQDPDRMQLIQETISDLLGQMSLIREKATESEAVVRNITKDIQVLDLAKRNLIASMTTLKRLQMLVSALNQLEGQVKEKKYRDISQSLAAVKEISSSFKGHASIKHISRIWKRIQHIQGELRGYIDADFDAFFLQDSSRALQHITIADACLVVDVLGSETRTQLIDRYAALELKEYCRIFRLTDEAGQLDNITRRFAWFKRLLQTHETEQGRIFPAEWKVGWFLLAKFVEITRDDLTGLLSKAGNSLTVTSLLEALQYTIDFEQSMAKRWGLPLTDLLATISPNAAPQNPKLMSSAFEPHMGVFVDAQDRALLDLLTPHLKSSKLARSTPRPSLDSAVLKESSTEEDTSPTVVLPSSMELFSFYRQSLENFSKFTVGRPLYDLANLFKKWLRIYAEEVLVASIQRPSYPSRRSTDSRSDLETIKQACLLINTADYCYTTASELQQTLCKKVLSEYQNKIDFQVEQDLFVSAISAAISALLLELETVCEPAFSIMSRTPWPTLKQVSGPSAYTTDLVQAAEQVMEAIKMRIEVKKYLKNLFDKACSLLLSKFTNALVRSRPLKEVGAEQLLIDLQVLKSYLGRMPGEALVTPNYTRALVKNCGHLEALLKVIVTPVDPPEGFILNYTLLIGDASFSNFQKILDLKGTPKAEQNHLLDSFVTITSTRSELESTSFLSALDMEPGGNTLTPPSSRITGSTPSGSSAESVFSSLASPPLSGPSTGSSGTTDSTLASRSDARQVFPGWGRILAPGLDLTQGADDTHEIEPEVHESPRNDDFIAPSPKQLMEKLDKLQLNPPQSRWFGQSSGYQLVQTALDIKGEYTGVEDAAKRINTAKRHEFWEHPSWRNPERAGVETQTPYSFPEEGLMAIVLDAYFQHINAFLPLLHRPTFKKSISDNEHLRDRGFGAIVLLACALGSRYSEDHRTFADPTEPRSSGWQWFQQVVTFRSSFAQRPSLYELQGFALHVLFAQSSEMPQGVWTQIGLALRMTQEVGAHRRRLRKGAPSAEDELWKRAFWVIVCIDRFITANSGRPLSLQPEDIDVDLPTECDDEYWDCNDAKLNFRQPPEVPSAIAFFNCYVKLMDILASAMKAIYSLKKPLLALKGSGQHILPNLDSALNNWMGSLPEHLRWNPAQENTLFLTQSAWLHAVYYYVQIFTHRPFIPSPRNTTPFTYPSLAICTNAARSCCHLLDIQTRRGILPHPHVQVTAFTSGVVLLLSIWTGKRHGCASYPTREFQDVQKCLDILKECERRWAIAGRLWDLLSELASIGDLKTPQVQKAKPKEYGEPLPLSTPIPTPTRRVTPSLNKFGSYPDSRSTLTNTIHLQACPNYALPSYTNELERLPVCEQSSAHTDQIQGSSMQSLVSLSHQIPQTTSQLGSSAAIINSDDVFMGSEVYSMDDWYRYQPSAVDSLAAAEVLARLQDRQSATLSTMQWNSVLSNMSVMDDQTMMMWTSAPTGLE
ncbi:hypothetical protein AX16_002090 [Volvariella volvacea WC 439]|nr:hypothetical protein AX16_002090 [Volvariella volvacea WC 439]